MLCASFGAYATCAIASTYNFLRSFSIKKYLIFVNLFLNLVGLCLFLMKMTYEECLVLLLEHIYATCEIASTYKFLRSFSIKKYVIFVHLFFKFVEIRTMMIDYMLEKLW